MSSRPAAAEPVGSRDPAGSRDLSDREVEARLEAARRSGRPLWLWPEVQPARWRAALGRIEEVLRADLIRAPLPRLGDDGGARAIEIAGFTSGTGPLLGRWVEEGRLHVAPRLAGVFRLHLEHGRRRWKRLHTRASEAIDVLAELGLSPIVLKGVHTAPAFFPEPGTRPSSDVDLAVPPRDFPSALAALERAGYSVERSQTALGRVELLPPGEARSLRSLDLLHADAPIRVDLHAGLDRALLGVGRLELGEPRAGETMPDPALHRSARVLAEPILLASLAAHASEGLQNLTLLRVYELALVARAETARGGLDWDALLERAGRPSHRFLFCSLEMAERLAPGTVPDAVRDALRAQAPPALRRAVAAMSPAGAQRFEGLTLGERLMWVGSAGELAGRLADLLWPASAGGSWARVAGIYADRVRRLRHAARSADDRGLPDS